MSVFESKTATKRLKRDTTAPNTEYDLQKEIVQLQEQLDKIVRTYFVSDKDDDKYVEQLRVLFNDGMVFQSSWKDAPSEVNDVNIQDVKKPLPEIDNGDCLPAALIVTKYQHDNGLKYPKDTTTLKKDAAAMRRYLKIIASESEKKFTGHAAEYYSNELRRITMPLAGGKNAWLTDASLAIFSQKTKYSIYSIQKSLRGIIYHLYYGKTEFKTEDGVFKKYKLVSSITQPTEDARPALILVNSYNMHWYGVVGSEGTRYWTVPRENPKKFIVID